MNNALWGAYKKGLKAGREGKKKSSCPYYEWATATVGRGRVIPTFERAFARAWKEGWEEGNEGCNCENPPPPTSHKKFLGSKTWHCSNDCPVHGEEDYKEYDEGD